MESNKPIDETLGECENSKREASSGLGRGLNALVNGRDKRSSFGLGKGLDVLIGRGNTHISSSDKK